MSDTQYAIGKLCNPSQGRDAVHIAVAPVIARERLKPGDHVDANGGWSGERVGIVDPFLTAPVERGQRFFLFLYPNTITGLRHVWTHPAFAPKVPGKDNDASQ